MADAPNAPQEPGNPNPRFALLYPIAFFGLTLFLCLWILHGNRISHPLSHGAGEHHTATPAE